MPQLRRLPTITSWLQRLSPSGVRWQPWRSLSSPHFAPQRVTICSASCCRLRSRSSFFLIRFSSIRAADMEPRLASSVHDRGADFHGDKLSSRLGYPGGHRGRRHRNCSRHPANLIAAGDANRPCAAGLPDPMETTNDLGRFRLVIRVLLGLTPSIWTACVAPHQFYFDNFRFPRLRLLDPADTRAQKTMTWWRKGRFFIKEVVGPSWPLFLAYGLFGMRSAKHWWQQRTAAHFPCALIVAVIPFVFLGCSTPSRYQYQHYYVFVPLMALGIAYGANAVPWKSRSFRGITLTLPVLNDPPRSDGS